jgi:hypothetical protein
LPARRPKKSTLSYELVEKGGLIMKFHAMEAEHILLLEPNLHHLFLLVGFNAF